MSVVGRTGSRYLSSSRRRWRLPLCVLAFAAAGCTSLPDRVLPSKYDRTMSEFRSAAKTQASRSTAFLADQTSRAVP